MKHILHKTALLAVVVILSFIRPAFANSEIEALRAQIKMLEARLDEMEKREQVRNANTQSIQAPSIKEASTTESVATDAGANVEIGKKGLSITSPDKQFGMKVSGYMQVDSRTFFTGAGKGDSELLARRLRPTLAIQAYKDFSFRLMPDFAGSSTRVFDAHADYRYSDALRFRAGKFKPPVSFERLQSAADTIFAERGHPSNLAPNRDYGVMLYGEPTQKMEYQLGIFNGNADLANSDGDDDNHKDVAGRIFAQPFKDSESLKGLGIGVGGSIGKRMGNTTTTQLSDYRTPGQQSFFRYATGTFADGVHTRVYPQAYYYYHSLGMIAEYALSMQEVTSGANSARLQHQAWQIAASYILTGENASFQGSVVPKRQFKPASGDWGAFELAGRVGETDIDNDAFPLFASATASASNARSYGAGINWYLNENLKLMLDYDFTQFDGGATNGDRDNEQVAIFRTQFRF